MELKDILVSIEHHKKAVEVLNNGGVIIFPTETVFGIATRCDNKEGIEKIRRLKGRDKDKPFSLMMPKNKIQDYCETNTAINRFINYFMPGQVTFVLKEKSNLSSLSSDKIYPISQVLASDKTIGVRVPYYPKLLDILNEVECPLVVTSANISNESNLSTIEEVCTVFFDSKSKDKSVDLILYDDELEFSKVPSTVVSVFNMSDESEETRHAFKVLREGNVSYDDLLFVADRPSSLSNIYIGCDHGGFTVKNEIVKHLESEGFLSVTDCGTYSLDSCDYPLFAFKVAENVVKTESSLGIVICTTGIGISIAANKVDGIRCGVCYSENIARKMVEHNNANIISLGAQQFKLEELFRFVDFYLNSKFEGGRHQRRVDEIDNYKC